MLDIERFVYTLELCPYCGSNKVEVWSASFDDPVTHFVVCKSCRARGPERVELQKAIELWNELSKGVYSVNQIKADLSHVSLQFRRCRNKLDNIKSMIEEKESK